MKQIIYIVLFLFSSTVFATHNRAGEITFTYVSGTTYQITVITYTKASSPSDRPMLEIRYCGSFDSIPRVSKVLMANDIYKNTYIAQHTFPGSTINPCVISVEDPNRNSGIMNIPNSVNVVFYIETEFWINPFVGINNSPLSLIPPIDSACLNTIYTYNSGTVDADGDSLHYTLQQSLKEGGQQIPNYQFPQASNSFTIDNFTGIITWDTPMFTGLYNFAVLIEEYRNGIKIGSVFREIQVDVKSPCIVGVNEQIDKKLSLQVYPNPFNNTLTIDYEIGNSPTILFIYNGIGKEIAKKIIAKKTTVIDLSTHPNGIYFVSIIDGNNRVTKKIIKQ